MHPAITLLRQWMTQDASYDTHADRILEQALMNKQSMDSSPDDVPGGVPSLRPGDVVQVGDNIGVISKSQVVIDGSVSNWYAVKPIVNHGNMPCYAIEWGSVNGLRNAWWERAELKIVALGPFHKANRDSTAPAAESTCTATQSDGSAP